MKGSAIKQRAGALAMIAAVALGQVGRVRANAAPVSDRQLYRQGAAAFKDGKYEDARAAFVALWKRGAYREGGGLALALAGVYLKSGDHGRALYFLEQAVEGCPASTCQRPSAWSQIMSDAVRPVMNNLVQVRVQVPSSTREVLVDGQPLVKLDIDGLRDRFPQEDWDRLGGRGPGCVAGVRDLEASLLEPDPVDGPADCRAADGAGLLMVLATTEDHTLTLQVERADGLLVPTSTVVSKGDLRKHRAAAGPAKPYAVDARETRAAFHVSLTTVSVQDEEVKLEIRRAGQARGQYFIPYRHGIDRSLTPGAYSLHWHVPEDVVLESADGQPIGTQPLNLLAGEQRSTQVTARREDSSIWESPWLWGGAAAVLVGGVVVAVVCASGNCTDQEQPERGSLDWSIRVPR